MDSSSCVEQKGVIEEIANGRAKVRISSFTACSDCHAQKSCGISGTASRCIEVPVGRTEFLVGETVSVSMERSLGLKASILAYLVPFLLMICLLILLKSIHASELISGVSTLLLVSLYFFGLYLFRYRMQKAFTFILHKMS